MAETATSMSSHSLPEPRQPVILVVDDDPFVLDTICAMLVHSGFTALRAGSVKAALALARLRSAPIHLLLSDVLLPEMSGPDMAQRFLALHPEARCLFMAGLPDSPEISEKIFSRGLPFLAKPFLPATLAEKVRQVLGRSSVAVMRAGSGM
jgi:two-component system, cell cycle sensor histidine kinase and response regulator CckA